MRVTFLGTAAARPTPARGVSATLVEHGGARVLIDCGEGTERQLLRWTGDARVDVILVTHGHADHVLGIPSLVAAHALGGRLPRVYAPSGAEGVVLASLELVF